MPLRKLTCFSSNEAGARPAAIDLTSPPTQNVPPAPLSSTARTSVSSAARRAASTSPRVMSGLSALRRSGRFMVMVRRPLSRDWRTISLDDMVISLLLLLLLDFVIASDFVRRGAERRSRGDRAHEVSLDDSSQRHAPRGLISRDHAAWPHERQAAPGPAL